jgi:hypothetical protein
MPRSTHDPAPSLLVCSSSPLPRPAACCTAAPRSTRPAPTSCAASMPPAAARPSATATPATRATPTTAARRHQPDIDATCKADCGQNAYCSEGACYCELDHVAVCGVNAGCLPEARLCDDTPDCPNSADENVAVCSDPGLSGVADHRRLRRRPRHRVAALRPGARLGLARRDLRRSSPPASASRTTRPSSASRTRRSASPARRSTVWGLNLDGSGESATRVASSAAPARSTTSASDLPVVVARGTRVYRRVGGTIGPSLGGPLQSRPFAGTSLRAAHCSSCLARRLRRDPWCPP